MEFDFTMGVAVFGSSLAIDALGAYYTMAAAERQAGRATIAGAAMILLGAIGLIGFLGDWRMIVPETIGASIGTYLTIKYYDRTKVTE